MSKNLKLKKVNKSFLPEPISSVFGFLYVYKHYERCFYDWALLNNRDIRDKYVVELRNRFETLQEKTEKRTPNDEYENFVNAHLEAAAKCIPTKPKTKYRVTMGNVSGERKTCTSENSLQKLSKKPTNTNARKLKTAQYQLAGIYIKEQTEYIQNQIDKIRDSVEDRQSRIDWQTTN